MQAHTRIHGLFAILAVLAITGCAAMRLTPEQKARQKQIVEENIAGQHYTIDINQMIPMRGPARMVNDFSLSVEGNRLISYLPYFGRAYNVPYGGGKGLNFTAPIASYKEYMRKNGLRHIEIGLSNEEDTYLYTIEVFDNGSSSVEVRARQRERISYSGYLEFGQ